MKRWIVLLIMLLFLMPIQAQEAFIDYRWEFGDLALRYPSTWDEPLQRFSTDGNQVMLMLAQNLVDDANRPPAIPFITVSLLRGLETDALPYEALENALETIEINPIGELPAALFGEAAIGSQGYSRDGLLFGLGRIHYLDEVRGSLLVVGRAPTTQRDEFVALFNSIANSITFSANQATNPPAYGILWHNNQDFVSGENALLDIVSMTLSEDGLLYVLDKLLGIAVLDAQTGVIQSLIPFDETMEASALLVSNNRYYLADTLCSCIHIYENGRKVGIERSFGEFAPRSMALAPDGRLYATEFFEEQSVIRAMSNQDERYFFDLPPYEQPLLAVDRAGRLLVLADNTLVYALENGVLTFQYELQASVYPTAFTVDFDNRLVVATDGNGILLFNSLGEVVNQIPTDENLPVAVAAGQGGIIYWAAADGTNGSISALSLGVEQGRIGTSNLRSGVEVQGLLEGSIQRQLWTFDGLRGEIVALNALADVDSFELDLALRILDPTGREIASADNDELGILANSLDAQIVYLSLPSDGQYYLIVERLAGEGRYRIGYNKSSLITINENRAQVTGFLNETMPLQRWTFEGRAGSIVTITMQSAEGNLDTVLRLLSARGDLLLENDDAEDPELGFNSQIFQYRLSSTGLYTIEASRFIGEGTYTLTIGLE